MNSPKGAPTPGQAFGGHAERAPEILLRVIRLTSRYRTRLALAGLASLGACLANLALPWLVGRAVDQAQRLLAHGAGHHPGEPQPWHALSLIALMLLLASTVRGLLQMAAGYQSEHVGQSVARDLRLAFFDKLQNLGFDYHDRVHSGDLITRGMLDLEGTRGFIEVGLQRSIQLALLLLIGTAGLFLVDPLMALATLSFVPFVVWRAGRMGLQLRAAWTQVQERMAVLTRVMEENLQGARVVRAFPARAHELDRFDRTGDEALELANRRITLRAQGMAMINATYYGAMLLLLLIGAHRIAAGSITIGNLAQCLAYMTILQLPVRQTSMIMNSAARAVSSGARVFEVLDAVPRVADRPGAVPLIVSDGLLRFENVCFAYPGHDDRIVLEDVSFQVRRGQTLGIVGPSGAGKSSIAQLVPRFYEPIAGRISIDGRDIASVTLASLRSAVALVHQDVFLFDDDAASNIGYGDPEAEALRIEAAADAAQIHDHFAGLPEGYATGLGERGSSLSGGQRQRASIARGLLPDPRILIFDDSTSAVDAATEQKVRLRLRERTADASTIIISHRLTSLMHADEILVLDAGRIVERGNHAELIARDGAYADLYRLQTADPMVDKAQRAVA